jgi:glutathione synthase/RimK-type ligase-like ATP-grasp enzyme
MILFYGYSTDDPLALAVEAARELEVEFRLIDQAQDCYHDALIEFAENGLELQLIAAGAQLNTSEITAVYARPLTPPAGNDRRANERAEAVHEALLEWMDTTERLVVNKPSAMHSNTSKPFQAQAIASAGFVIPATLITSEPQAVRDFWSDHGELVFKSTSGIRSIVQRLDHTNAERLNELRNLPVQFQEHIDGTDVRVHVIGERIFSAEIQSAAVDYRYAQRDGIETNLTRIELPDDVAGRCIKLAAQLELPFAGIDLRRQPDGDYVCFEVNPMPGYSYFERETGDPISRALVTLLAGGERRTNGASCPKPNRNRRHGHLAHHTPHAARL